MSLYKIKNHEHIIITSAQIIPFNLSCHITTLQHDHTTIYYGTGREISWTERTDNLELL